MHKKLGVILSDRGSKYAVSGGPAKNRAEVDALLKSLKRDKAYAKATHNTWGVLFADGTPLKGDDGESGAGMVILRMLERGRPDRSRDCCDPAVRRQTSGRATGFAMCRPV